jgi:hypothetical protein
MIQLRCTFSIGANPSDFIRLDGQLSGSIQNPVSTVRLRWSKSNYVIAQGNTCYMNTLVVLLHHSPLWSETIKPLVSQCLPQHKHTYMRAQAKIKPSGNKAVEVLREVMCGARRLRVDYVCGAVAIVIMGAGSCPQSAQSCSFNNSYWGHILPKAHTHTHTHIHTNTRSTYTHILPHTPPPTTNIPVSGCHRRLWVTRRTFNLLT